MVSVRDKAKKNLDKMIKGAARELNSSNGRLGASSPSVPAAPVSVYAQLQAQIDKNGKTIQKVPLESIKLDENIRESYDEQGLKVLAESMQRDGLIQFPTLCLKATPSGEFSLVCKNGHRRILAAKLLGWQLIESVILPFASARDELYHTIAANLREDVFYLDLAQAYQQAHHLGESDTSIAERVGVNVRTVGWYRRLTKLPSECQVLCRQYPDLFNATWAIKLARKGELPAAPILLKHMQQLLSLYKAQKEKEREGAEAAPLEAILNIPDSDQKKQAKDSLKSIFSGAHGPQEAQMAWRIVEQLCTAGYFKASLLQKLRRQLVPSAPKASRAQGATVAG